MAEAPPVNRNSTNTVDSGGESSAARNRNFLDKVEKKHKEYKRYQWNWSWAYHIFTWGAVILSAASAVVIKLDIVGDQGTRDNLAFVLSAVASALIAIMTAGGFHGSWRANLRARYDLEQLANEVDADPAPDIQKYTKRLNAIINEATVRKSG